MKASLFTGVTVLELGHVIAGPFAASLLADFGATVIKVEQPGIGDTLRSTGPAKDGHHVWWKAAARNKKFITIDLRDERGQDLVRRLASQSDVVIENFRPGTLERWNLGWSDLQAINAQLIMLRISGYGQIGPESRKPGFGRVGEAMSGAVNIQGFPESQPTHFGFSLGDLSTGVMGAFAIAGALYRKGQEGDTFEGECIDLALYESLFRFIDWQTILYDQLGFVPQRNGNYYPTGVSPISNTYETKDGKWVTLASVRGETFFRILSLIGGEEARSDPRFSTYEKQIENRAVLDTLVREWIRERSREKVLQACDDAGAVAAPVLSPDDIATNETYLARENIISVPDETFGEVKMHGVIPRLQNYPGAVRHVGGSLGKDNDEVLTGMLGISADEYSLLQKEKVI